MFYSITVVALGFALDLLLGDPHWMPHPVRWMGRLTSFLELVIRRVFPKTQRGERWGGALLALLVIDLSVSGVWLLLWLAGRLHYALPFCLQVWFCYQLLAAKSLRDESMKVWRALQKGDLPGARRAVSMIVGRDTDKLSPTQVAKAAVETVAENASDGVAAPLFYLLLGGVPLGMLYKAVNTLDSMVGYKNERYRWFGWASARLDDLLNWIPSRLCALAMIVSAGPCGLDWQGAWQIWRRDRRRHPSPNSAQTEAACAGALGVQLLGGARYGGVWVEKEALGDDLRPVTGEDIRLANRLMYAASVLCLTAFALARFIAEAIHYY